MASSILRFRKLCYVEPVKYPSLGFNSLKETQANVTEGPLKKKKEKEEVLIKTKTGEKTKQWRCIDSCYWSIGCLCSAWWFLLFLFHCLPPTLTLPQFRVTELPGDRLKREEGLTALHPVVLVPGIVTGGLELWEGKPCTEGLFRKRLWGGSFAEIFKRSGTQKCHHLPKLCVLFSDGIQPATSSCASIQRSRIHICLLNTDDRNCLCL